MDRLTGACVQCGRLFITHQNAPLKRCCGQAIRWKSEAAERRRRSPAPLRQYFAESMTACRSCEHWNRKARCGGCLIGGVKCGKLEKRFLAGGPCFDGRFSYFRDGVGFLAVSYLEIGGTEVWHQTLLPRLGDDAAGFVCLNRDDARGDLSRLGCPVGTGLEAARALAESCRVLVAWGIGGRLADVLDGIEDRPEVISVSHCGPGSDWTAGVMIEQAPHTDRAVYICPSALQSVPPELQPSATLIPNAADPERIKPTMTREAARDHFGFAADQTWLVVPSRISEEKRLHVLTQAMRYLPDHYRLLIAGTRQPWCAAYYDQIASMADDRVRIIDAVDPPGDLYAAADAVLSASRQEGYGLAMAEAILAGVPVIATLTGLLEFEASLAAIVPHDAPPWIWARAILADFADPGQLGRVDKARRWIGQHHSAEAFVDSWRDVANCLPESQSR